MRTEWLTNERAERRKKTGEDFTPPEIVDLLLENQKDLFDDFSKTFLDPCIGIGFIYIGVLKKRFQHCKNTDDILKAIETMYGTELMEDNVLECKSNIWSEIFEFMKEQDITDPDGHLKFQDKVFEILDHNIICTDTFKWDYENWCPMREDKALPLF